MADQPLTYKASGVDIGEAERALRGSRAAILATHTERVLGGIGGFGALFSAAFPTYDRPVLVSSIDGVGTKTRVAAMAGDHRGLGHDIVNHCVNDILCQGARPLFFLDYYGCSRLEAEVFEQVLGGMAEACQQNGCALIGGETAEMPGVYAEGEIDVVGTIIGLVDLDRKLPRGTPQAGDLLVGVASNGLHTNGYSLARKALFDVAGMGVHDRMPGGETTLGEELLRPHRSYFTAVYGLMQDMPAVYGAAHITGGGLYDNLPRALPTDLQARIDRRSWSPPAIFRLIQEAGNVADHEMFRTFNMGIGMVLVVARDAGEAVVKRLNESGEAAAVIGELQRGPHDVQIV